MFDLIVIGGGPGGTSAAITCARAGACVLLLERGRFAWKWFANILDEAPPSKVRVCDDVLPDQPRVTVKDEIEGVIAVPNRAGKDITAFRQGCESRAG